MDIGFSDFFPKIKTVRGGAGISGISFTCHLVTLPLQLLLKTMSTA